MESYEALEKMVALQTTDSGLDELEKLKKGFLQEIADLEKGLEDVKGRVQEAKKNMEELVKQRRSLEVEVVSWDNKIKKYQDQEPEVKSNEQFIALKTEIEKGKEDKGKVEEKILEFLFLEDEAKKKGQELAAEQAKIEKKLADDRKVLQEKIDDCDKAAVGKKAERAKQFSEVPEEFGSIYENIRAHGKKVAVAGIGEDQMCGGCHMTIAPQVINELRKNIKIQFCRCGRFIYLKD